jgi:seryl-tRNA synthetase
MSVGLQRLREDPDGLRQAAQEKREDPSLVDRAVAVDTARRRLSGEADALRAQRKDISAQVGATLGSGGSKTAVEGLRERSVELGRRIEQTEGQLGSLEEELEQLMLRIPNPADPDVPRGGPEATATIRSWGKPLAPDADGWTRKPHWEIATALGMLDLPGGAKITGTGFPVFRGAGAALERALINFFLDVHTREHGMLEIWPPVLVNQDSARGTGQIPDKEEQMYVVTRDDLYLIPTAEVPVTNLHRDEILEVSKLPINYVAYSASFRREAGAAGRQTRGILRVHQFDKVEMVAFVRPENSADMLEWLTSAAEVLLQRLGLAYRVRLLATGDMGFTQAKTHDLEVWAPGAGEWLEVSSVSNFRDFQARRMNIRYRPSSAAKPEIVHTLNGSGLALPRTVAALIEVYQRPDGSVVVPEVLRPYLGRDSITPA